MYDYEVGIRETVNIVLIVAFIHVYISGYSTPTPFRPTYLQSCCRLNTARKSASHKKGGRGHQLQVRADVFPHETDPLSDNGLSSCQCIAMVDLRIKNCSVQTS